jgi:hypothetical protein
MKLSGVQWVHVERAAVIWTLMPKKIQRYTIDLETNDTPVVVAVIAYPIDSDMQYDRFAAYGSLIVLFSSTKRVCTVMVDGIAVHSQSLGQSVIASSVRLSVFPDQQHFLFAYQSQYQITGVIEVMSRDFHIIRRFHEYGSEGIGIGKNSLVLTCSHRMRVLY